MVRFESVRIGDLGKVVTGRTPKTSVKEYYGSDYMFIGPKDLHNHFFIKKSEKTISKIGLDHLRSNVLNGTTILVGCIGWDMGNVGIVNETCATNQQINSITQIKDKYNPLYIYYLLKQKKSFLFQQANVTRTPILNKTKFSDLILRVPQDKGEQDKVTSVLITIDRKIELNNRINAELEAMAKTLYDYWFVQFDFPDANGKPYKTSGRKMVYNETLKRKIPEGWVAGNILRVADLIGGGTPKKSVTNFWGGQIPFFTPSDSISQIYSVATEANITEDGLHGSSTRLLEKDTVLITARGSVGRLMLCGVPMAMNQSCYALKAKTDVSHTYLYFLTKELIHHLHVKASGSVFNSIVSNDIEFTNLALPADNEILSEFSQRAEPMFKKIELGIKENQKLTALRDWLLPMLMNGQVTVK